MQNEIKTKQKLFDESGSLANPGYAKHLLFEYSRKAIKASSWRIKEWDYYAVLTDEYGFSCTIADLSYSCLIGVTFFDFKAKTYISKSKIGWFTFGKLKLPETSEKGNVGYHRAGFDLDFIRSEQDRRLHCVVKEFDGLDTLEADLVLKDLHDDSMVIATPWPKKKFAFYLNQKVNCQPTSGIIKIGSREYDFNETDAFSVLDWGRGVWTYKNTWYWGSASGVVAGSRFGFNIGYGFGNTSQASENMLFFDGKAHKLDQVTFHLDDQDYLKPWQFTSNDGRFEMTMTPLIDRRDDTNFVIIKNIGHQVFGRFSGWVILDDGSRLEVKDLLGFAEKITNHY